MSVDELIMPVPLKTFSALPRASLHKALTRERRIKCFDDFSKLLTGDLEFFHYPVLDLRNLYGDAYVADTTFVLQNLETFSWLIGSTFEQALQSYGAYVRHAALDYLTFQKTGRYGSLTNAETDIGSEDEYQQRYLCTLALSTPLNRGRYELFKHYRRLMQNYLAPGAAVLEIGCGNCLDSIVASCKGRVDAYELNPFSLYWQEILGLREKINLHIEPCSFDLEESYDFVIMIELLEHLRNPSAYLDGAYRVLKNAGFAYFTFAIRMPQADHLFQFNSVDECRDLLQTSGFRLVEEFCTISTYRPFDESERWLLAADPRYAVIYCCLTQKASGIEVDSLIDAFNSPCDVN